MPENISKPERVLVVDDSAVARSIARKLVRELIPDVVVCEGKNAQHGFDVWSEARPDCAILDLNMPGDSGLDLAERIKILDPDARLVLCTANVQDAVRQRAEALGIGFVNKPLTPAKLAEALALEAA